MSAPLTRALATRLLAERLGAEVVVTNLGQATLELQQAADRPLNFYVFGSMGQCSSIGLGIALARPDVRVICLDGDGSLLMNLGSLCTIATEAPPLQAGARRAVAASCLDASGVRRSSALKATAWAAGSAAGAT